MGMSPGLALLSVILVVLSSGAFAQNKDESHPSFLEAGIFFITAREPPKEVRLLSSRLATVIDFRKVPGTGALRDGVYEFKTLEEYGPCTILSFLLDPPYGMRTVDFNKLPSPRAMKLFGGEFTTAEMELPNQAWCETKTTVSPEGLITVEQDTTTCFKKYDLGGYKIDRRLKALDYIRNNFCPGQPEPPPPPPPKPY